VWSQAQAQAQAPVRLCQFESVPTGAGAGSRKRPGRAPRAAHAHTLARALLREGGRSLGSMVAVGNGVVAGTKAPPGGTVPAARSAAVPRSAHRCGNRVAVGGAGGVAYDAARPCPGQRVLVQVLPENVEGVDEVAGLESSVALAPRVVTGHPDVPVPRGFPRVVQGGRGVQGVIGEQPRLPLVGTGRRGVLAVLAWGCGGRSEVIRQPL
jgi:hypothetical protein